MYSKAVAKTYVQGGKKLDAWFRRAGKGSIKRVEIGWFRSARYPSRYRVILKSGKKAYYRRRRRPTAAMVAIWNELGTRFKGKQAVPPRPFLRPAFIGMRSQIRKLLKAHVDPREMVITPQVGDLIGMAVQTEIRERIDAVHTPPLSEETARRKGSTKPLIDTGLLRRMVTWRVRK